MTKLRAEIHQTELTQFFLLSPFLMGKVLVNVCDRIFFDHSESNNILLEIILLVDVKISTKYAIYPKDTEPLYHAFMYSPIFSY